MSAQEPVKINYLAMSETSLLNTVGDDAALWADAFQQIVVRRGIPIDVGLMIGWFANAIEHSSQVRERRSRTPTSPVVESLRDIFGDMDGLRERD